MSIRDKPHYAQIEIDEYSSKGNGLGRYERSDRSLWPVEVPFTVPGDIVKTRLLRKRSGIYRGAYPEFIKQSAVRINPRCRHFADCGGCRWQQIPYDLQLKNKQQLISKHFRDLITKETEIKKIIPNESVWRYRNRMDFSFSGDAQNNFYLGLVKDSGKGKVLNLQECPLCPEWFLSCLSVVRRWTEEERLSPFHAIKNSGTLRSLVLREGKNTGDRMINLFVSGNPQFALKKGQLESFKNILIDAVKPTDRTAALSIFLTIQQTAVGSPTQFFEMHLHGTEYIRERLIIKAASGDKPLPFLFRISPSSFFQPNSQQAENIYSRTMEMADIQRDAVVYDLYSGTGTLGIIAASRAKEVIGIEQNRQAVLDAKLNATSNNARNITFISGSVPRVLRDIKENASLPQPDVVMIDPPRAGLDKRAIEEILRLQPKKLLYISCNPKTQARDVSEFLKNNYSLQSLQPLDQFPHTIHIENIALMTGRPL